MALLRGAGERGLAPLVHEPHVRAARQQRAHAGLVAVVGRAEERGVPRGIALTVGSMWPSDASAAAFAELARLDGGCFVLLLRARARIAHHLGDR